MGSTLVWLPYKTENKEEGKKKTMGKKRNTREKLDLIYSATVINFG